MLGLKWVITVEGNFEQAYYCKQDCIAQVATLITPYAPNGPGHDVGRAPVKEATKAATVLDQPSIGEATDGPSGSDGLAGPPSRRSAP